MTVIGITFVFSRLQAVQNGMHNEFSSDLIDCHSNRTSSPKYIIILYCKTITRILTMPVGSIIQQLFSRARSFLCLLCGFRCFVLCLSKGLCTPNP